MDIDRTKSSTLIKAVHIIVKGNVQGVFFRKYSEEKAKELGIKGTVENLVL